MSMFVHDKAVQLSKKAQLLFDKVNVLFGNSKYDLFFEHYPPQPQDGEVSFLWPFSSMYSAVITLLKLTGSTVYKRYLEKLDAGLSKYLDTVRKPPAYQVLPTDFGTSERFYDDNEWLGLELAEAYNLTRDEKYLAGTKNIYEFIMSGFSEELGGGIYWCEQKKEMKNTCSNGPGALLCLKLYRITGNQDYFSRGLELYRWTQKNLQDHDHLYMDHIKTDGSKDITKYAYNSGTMLHSALELYLITKEEDYLNEAHQIAKASLDYFAPERPDGKRFYPKGMPWFTSVLFRAYAALYEIDGKEIYVGSIIGNLEYAWENARDKTGLVESDWSGETTNDTKWLLDQASMVEMYARAALILNNK